MTDSKRKRLSFVFALSVLVVSVMSVTQNAIVEYNRDVRSEQNDRKMIADYGATFSADAWGINYAKRNRNFIFALCIVGFIASLWIRSLSFAIIPYGLTFPLIYQWITKTARDVELAELYMRDSPYLLRIASTFDWALFALLAITFSVFLFLLVQSLASARPNLK